MKILIVLTYYRPHISGLTIYAERLAKAFVARGHEVTVLTSGFRKALAAEEIVEGVRIVRAPVLFRLSKGVIMPTFGLIANRLVREADVIQLHLPQFDAAGISFRGRLLRKPTVITYHCDLLMPPGLFNRIANLGVSFMNQLTGMFTHRIVTYTQDYADNSAYLKRYFNKLKIIPPPVVLPGVTKESVESFAREHNPQNRHPVIGMATRFASEKGVEVLLKALPEVIREYPDAVVQFVGTYQKVFSEQAYFERLRPEIEKYQASGNWQFLGELDPEQMAKYYPNLDVLTVPSLNSTEAFGLVQIEAMMNGVPCVTSSLPGVRQPVKIHDMGAIFPIGDSQALAKGLIAVIKAGKANFKNKLDFSRYQPDDIAQAYEELFQDIRQTH
ncbi:MAG: glycosyltransferase family 1 protein [Chloroflexi bacterium HGW-Chloroflexi-5]|jgi:glycosyltransferase involved in cell wall biosynthesis|nr:MAG: glycosyltransferase family 1 protein [Chloroflexi bacterium HGW-Chloroflexi-5]